MADREIMTAADLCDECGHGGKLLGVDPKTRMTRAAKPCPTCGRQATEYVKKEE